MPRTIEITHIYNVDLPMTATSQDAIKALSDTAVGIMENHMKEMRGVRNLHSDWKLMPKYVAPALTEMTVEEFEKKANLFPDEQEAEWSEVEEQQQIESGQ